MDEMSCSHNDDNNVINEINYFEVSENIFLNDDDF